jgi:hypothetical protein
MNPVIRGLTRIQQTRIQPSQQWRALNVTGKQLLKQSAWKIERPADWKQLVEVKP